MVGRGVRTKGQVMLFGQGAQRIEDATGLDSRDSVDGVNLQDPVHVLGEIDNDRDVTALPAQARSGPASENRSTESPGDCNRGDDIVLIARDHHADRNLSIV